MEENQNRSELMENAYYAMTELTAEEQESVLKMLALFQMKREPKA